MNKRGLNPLILTFFKRLFNIAKNVFKMFKKYFFANWVITKKLICHKHLKQIHN